uniref:RNA polymerase II-associated protein 1 n=1 Tax=Trichobilharzia regenti TaxID=157069 RepID=A0AA85JY95_TRIRE|nr:unnamed protein product [Trichobilharzia regenti]
MLDKKAATDEQLLLEQAKFLCNQRSENPTNAYVSSSGGKKHQRSNLDTSLYENETRDSCFLPTIIERPVIRDAEKSDSSLPKRDYKPTTMVSRTSANPKSIFAKEMERAGFTRSTYNHSCSSAPSTFAPSHLKCLEYLKKTSPQTITGRGLGTRCNEIEKIHQENLERLSQLTEEEILQERERILAFADPSVLSFLMHKGRNVNSVDEVKTIHSKLEESFSKPIKPEISDLPLAPDPKIPHMDVLEADKLEWTRDLPQAAKATPSVELSTTGSSTKKSDNMDVDDGEEIGKSNKDSAERQARFDLSGLVVPPNAVVDTHLGLHHHGEEPERAGYTIGEMFHLCRSSVPAQRRLALSMLASALAQTRLGKHISYLAPIDSPSLITCLLSSKTSLSENSTEVTRSSSSGGSGGILFLLRWCLDEAVSTLTSTNAVGGDNETCGASLTLVVECIRCLANLICDTQGEIFLNYAHEWPIELIHKSCLFIAPPVPLINPHRRTQQSASDDGVGNNEEGNDSELAATDPVEFLFLRSQLARRIAWLLAPGKGRASVCLPADAAGLWLPSLIIRGIRHSPLLAYEIFRTPELVSALLTRYLPVNECHSSSKTKPIIMNRPNYLSTANNIPIPSILRLCRVWIQSSPNTLLAFVNDHCLVERCLSYLYCDINNETNNPNLTIAHLVAFIHQSLPLQLAIQLQIESIRCLGVCVSQATGPYKAVHLLEKNLLNIFQSAEKCWLLYHAVFINNEKQQGGHPEEDYHYYSYLSPLLGSWIYFLVDLSRYLIEHKKNALVQQQTVQRIIESVLNWCCQLAQHIVQHMKSDLITPIWESFELNLTEAGLNTSLMSVAITSIPSCLHLLSRIDIQLKTTLYEQVIHHWNTTLLSIFKLNFWNQMLCRFVRNESVLTGYPMHVRDVTASLLPDSCTNIIQQPDNQGKLDWSSVDHGMLLDDGVLQLVNLSPNCLPDYGCTLHFAYNAPYTRLTGFIWPKVINTTAAVRQTNTQQDECDQVTLSPEQMITRYLPLMSAMISALECYFLKFRIHMIGSRHELSMLSKTVFDPLIDWIKRFCQKSFLQWKSLSVTAEQISSSSASDEHHQQQQPNLLISIECELIARILLLFSQILEQDESVLSAYLKSALISDSFGGYNINHLAALRILPYLRKGQEGLRNRLISEVVFSSRQIEISNNINIEHIIPHLPEIKELYYRELVHVMSSTITTATTVENSPNNENTNQSRLSTHLEGITEEDSLEQSSDDSHVDFKLGPIFSKRRSICDRLIPVEWAYTPFLHAYLLSKSKKINEEDENYRKLMLDRSMNCLLWIRFLQRISTLSQSSFGFMQPIESIVRLTVGSIAYPGAGGLGFSPTGQLLAEILHSIGPIKKLSTVTTTTSTTGDSELASLLENVSLPVTCPSFYDEYIDLVNHYNALSYNSPVFANLVLWPCQQACHVKYRRALWGEHQQSLNSLRIVLNQLLIPLISFLEPEETNSSMIRVYASAILSGTVQVTRQPLLFLIAVHHLNRYLYNKANCNSEFTQQFIRLCKLLPQMPDVKLSTSSASVQTVAGSKSDLLNLLRYYKQPNQCWLQIKSPRLNTNLNVGVHDPLVVVHLVDDNDDNMNGGGGCDGVDDYMNVTSSATFSEAVIKAGIECYQPDDLPQHRQLYWRQLFEKV